MGSRGTPLEGAEPTAAEPRGEALVSGEGGQEGLRRSCLCRGGVPSAGVAAAGGRWPEFSTQRIGDVGAQSAFLDADSPRCCFQRSCVKRQEELQPCWHRQPLRALQQQAALRFYSQAELL